MRGWGRERARIGKQVSVLGQLGERREEEEERGAELKPTMGDLRHLRARVFSRCSEIVCRAVAGCGLWVARRRRGRDSVARGRVVRGSLRPVVTFGSSRQGWQVRRLARVLPMESRRADCGMEIGGSRLVGPPEAQIDSFRRVNPQLSWNRLDCFGG